LFEGDTTILCITVVDPQVIRSSHLNCASAANTVKNGLHVAKFEETQVKV